MGKLLLIIFLALSTSSFAKENEKQEILHEYTKALTLYKQKQYEDAYEIFNSLFEQNLNDVNINFYLGRSAFELQKYHDSIIAFERILFTNPESSRTKLELAKAYFMTKQYKTAKLYFQEVQEDPKLPSNIKETISKFLIAIDNTTQKSFLNGVVLVGLNYDSNIGNTAFPYLWNYSGTDIPISTNENSDWAHQEVVILNHKYVLDETTTLKNDLLLFAKTMNNHKNSGNDIKMISYAPALNLLYTNGLSVDYGIFFDALWIDDSSNLRTYGILPKITYMIEKDLIYTGYLKYQDKNYQNPDDAAKDSRYLELNNKLNYIHSKTTTYNTEFTYAHENKDSGTRVDVDKNSYNLKLAGTYLITPKISLAPTLSYKYTKYSDKSTLADGSYNERSDDEYKLSLISTYVYSAQWLYQLGGDYTRNRSNQDANNYKKNTFTFNIIRAF